MNLELIRKNRLFHGINRDELELLLKNTEAREKSFLQGDVVFHAGKPVSRIGLMTEGSVNLLKYDAWGNDRILDNVGTGEVFGETYACLRTEPLMVNVIAATDCRILFLDIRKILDGVRLSGPEVQLAGNLLTVLAAKNLNLSRKIDMITPRRLRERILEYLSWQSVSQGKRSFTIPFDRQQMADYLSVDRSALSAELSRMQKEGLIRFRKNHFQIL